MYLTQLENKTQKSVMVSAIIKTLLTLLSVSLLSGCIVIAESSHANFHQKRELTLDANSLNTLAIDSGAGELIVKGSAQVDQIIVTADIYTTADYQDNYDLELSASGTTGILVAKTKSSSGMWVGHSPHINIVVTMPESMMLNIDDGSGDIEVTNIHGVVAINDGSGGLVISNIGSSLKVKDGSGDLVITEVNGDVSVVDGSGDIELTNITGNLTIYDGSGSIYAKSVTGNALFEDGSGDLTVRKVGGVITVDDGSGDIDINEAGGLKILDSGSGGLKVKNVMGGFEIDN